MDEEVVGEMEEKRWSLGIWRMDVWMSGCGPEMVGFEGVVGRGVGWV